MTMTVKFPPELESGLRRYAEASGVAASVVIREAVAQYLVNAPAAARSAHSLGADLFGKHAGPAGLASERKAALAGVWADKQTRREEMSPEQAPREKVLPEKVSPEKALPKRRAA